MSDRLNERVAQLFDDHRGVFQPYIVGSMLEERRLYYVRAHVLLTPVGAQYLSAHRIVSGTPVPGSCAMESCRTGRLTSGSSPQAPDSLSCPPEEESGVVKATLGVARGLSAAAEYGFQTRPAQ